MILEVAPLHIRAGQSSEFEAAFRTAQHLIASMPGYRSHELRRCLERRDEEPFPTVSHYEAVTGAGAG